MSSLEKATSALESIVRKHDTKSVSGEDGKPALSARAMSDMDISSSQAGQIEDLPESVKAFADFLELYVDPFVSLSNETNPLVGEQANNFAKAFQFQAKLIKAAAKSKKPDFSNPANIAVLKPLQDGVAEINKFKDDNRSSEVFSHLNAIAEGTGVLSWFLTETPVSFIPEIKDSATFWTNKVLKQFKGLDQSHVEWVKQFLGIFDGLKLYVKQFHTSGLTWAVNGGSEFSSTLAQLEDGSDKDETSTSSSIPSAASVAPPSGTGSVPPPPPPPPPADIFAEDNKAAGTDSKSNGGGLDAVFSELNKGEGITKGLKKVDKSQMTHKNPELRKSDAVSTTSSKKSPPAKPKKPSSLSLKPKPEPVVELRDSKWIIKNVEGDHGIVINGEIDQSVFIADSKDATIQVKGKINAVSISSTTKVGLVVESLISGIDVINSKKFGIQVLDKVPQISIDKSDEGQIYLSKTSLETEVYTSSTTALNINVPDEANDDFKEISVPEQFKHTFSNGKISSTIVEHAG